MILITGSRGYIGRNFLNALNHAQVPYRTLVNTSTAKAETQQYSWDYKSSLDAKIFQGITQVVHLASVVHRSAAYENETQSLLEYRRVNVDATLSLARAAKMENVQRFVFASTVAVYGKNSCLEVVDESFAVNPQTSYGRSKAEAEAGLRKIFKDSATCLNILRIPLVYGVDAPGNVAALAKALRKGIPLPTAAIANRRSMIAVTNLSQLLLHLVQSSEAVSGTFNVADAQPYSTAELVSSLGKFILGKSPFQIPVPQAVAKFLLSNVFNKAKSYETLWGDLIFDCSKAEKELAFRPSAQLFDVYSRNGHLRFLAR